MNISKRVITSVVAGSVAGVVTGLLVKSKSKVKKDVKTAPSSKDNYFKEEDDHYFV